MTDYTYRQGEREKAQAACRPGTPRGMPHKLAGTDALQQRPRQHCWRL